MSSPLTLDVFVVPYRPVVPAVPPMGPGDPTWPATSNSLISGERDAVLVDTPLRLEDARNVVEWVRRSGKNLTTIVITDGHGDHFFGLATLLAAFPDARAVAAAPVVPVAQGQLGPEAMQFWNSIMPGQLVEHPVAPEPFDDDVIELDGHELRLITVTQADTSPSTMIHIPSLAAVLTGDVTYNGIHQYLAETDHKRRLGWLQSIDRVEALNPKVIVAGHQDPGASRDEPARIIGATRAYIHDFEAALAESQSAQELVDAMMQLYGDLGNPHTLWLTAYQVFAQGQAPSS
jgi:glyoxylase-like metal-dependent hydrolase (beta-lactamase superfamily II)